MAVFSPVWPPSVGSRCIGPFGFDHLGHHFPGDRLDVGAIGGGRIGHDRRRVAVHQHHFVALLAERFARLGAGVVKLARLADDDRAGTNDQNSMNVVASRHFGSGLGSGFSCENPR